MTALQSTETHNVTLENLALFRPKLRDSYSTNEIERSVKYYCCGVNVIESSMIAIRSRDSIIIPLMTEENRARFFTVSL